MTHQHKFNMSLIGTSLCDKDCTMLFEHDGSCSGAMKLGCVDKWWITSLNRQDVQLLSTHDGGEM